MKKKTYKITEMQFSILKSLSNVPIGKPEKEIGTNFIKIIIHALLTPFLHIPLLIIIGLVCLESILSINLKVMIGVFIFIYIMYLFKMSHETWQGVRYIFERMRIIIKEIEDNNKK